MRRAVVCGESVMTPALARVGLDYEISSRFQGYAPSYDPNGFSSVHPWVRDHGLGPLGGYRSARVQASINK